MTEPRGSDRSAHRVTVDEFLNPYSMITPGAAGGTVSLISAVLFKALNLSVVATGLIFSGIISYLVVHTEQFQKHHLGRVQRLCYWLLNSAIIFAMATGSTGVLSTATGSGVALNATIGPRIAVAQAAGQQVIKQQRPFFNDWTDTKRLNPLPTDSLHGLKLSYDVKRQDKGLVGNLLNATKLRVPTYDVDVRVVALDSTMGDIVSVEYFLEGQTFQNAVVKRDDPQKNFALAMELWRPFNIKAWVTLATGEEVVLTQNLILKPQQ